MSESSQLLHMLFLTHFPSTLSIRDYFQPSTGELFGGEISVKLEAASDNTSTLEGASCTSKQKQIGISKQSIKKVGSLTYLISK